MQPAILSIDEGTTGTRAAWVTEDGTVHGEEYRRLQVSTPRTGVVEQDAGEILAKTLEVCRIVIHRAAETGYELKAAAIATQRATAVLWDTVSGHPLVPAMVWQDTRHAAGLEALGSTWNEHLIPTVGRPAGVRSPYLWAAHHLRDSPAVVEAYAAKRLGFGTMETWLLWNLTRERAYVATSTNATSAGAYVLAEHRYETSWIQAMGFPVEILPELRQDAEELGTTDPRLLGLELPIRAAVGDQHAGTVGLGCLDAGQAMCVHGTGSFVDLVTGPRLPENPGLYDGTLTLTGWRRNHRSVYAVETFTATTGSALDWLCGSLGWFDSAVQISELAALASGANGVMFVPALTGIRVPVVEPRVRASLSGLSMATSRSEVAYAVLEGIAHSVASSVHANEEVAGVSVTEIRVGGGMAGSDPLIQMQADLTGMPMRRMPATGTASLRGAAFLAGADGLLWDSLETAAQALGPGELFEPAISAAERDERRSMWASHINRELEQAAG